MGSSKNTKKKPTKKSSKKPDTAVETAADTAAAAESKPVSMRILVGQIEALKAITSELNQEYGAKMGKVWQPMNWHDTARLIFDNAIEEHAKLGKLPRVSDLEADE